MKTLKIISTAVMLITGIITAITGAVETIIKLLDTLHPKLESAPVKGEALKQLKEIADENLQKSYFTFLHLGGTELIIIGVIIISLSLWIMYKTKLNEKNKTNRKISRSSITIVS